MKLEIDKSHKRIDNIQLKKTIDKLKLTVGGIGGSVLILLYSGILPPKVYAADDIPPAQTQSVEEVKIPEEWKGKIAGKVGKDVITKDDLQKIEFLVVTDLELVEDMSFLQYCTNLKDVYLTVQEGKSIKPLFNLPNLEHLYLTIKVDNLDFLNDLSNMQSLEKLDLNILWNDVDLTSDIQNKLLDQFPNLKKLSLSGISISNLKVWPGCEERLNKLEELDITFSTFAYDLDFKKLTGLKKLSFKNAKPYDIAVFLSTEEYNTLVNSGVEVEFESEEVRALYLKTAEKLDKIVEELDLREDSTDQEKIDAVLIYVLEHLQYDEELKEKTRQGTKTSQDSQQFYEKGMLYAVFEKETAICGNYAALVEALMDRISVPEQSIFITNGNNENPHAWNYVKVDGELYLVDATWLDDNYALIENIEEVKDESGNIVSHTMTFDVVEAQEAIRQGITQKLKWYLEDPSPEHISEIDERGVHTANIPSYMLSEEKEREEVIEPKQIERIEKDSSTAIPEIKEETIPDITDKKVKIKIGKKEIIISGGALIGIMSGLGVAIAVKKKKEKERRRRQEYDKYFTSNYNSYDDPFSADYRPRR